MTAGEKIDFTRMTSGEKVDYALKLEEEWRTALVIVKEAQEVADKQYALYQEARAQIPGEVSHLVNGKPRQPARRSRFKLGPKTTLTFEALKRSVGITGKLGVEVRIKTVIETLGITNDDTGKISNQLLDTARKGASLATRRPGEKEGYSYYTVSELRDQIDFNQAEIYHVR